MATCTRRISRSCVHASSRDQQPSRGRGKGIATAMVVREIFLVTEMPMPDRRLLSSAMKVKARECKKKGEMEQEGRVRLLAELDSVLPRLPRRAKGRE